MYQKPKFGFLAELFFLIFMILIIMFIPSYVNVIDDGISLLDDWLSSGYEVYIEGNLSTAEYTSKELIKNCIVTGYPNEGKIVCKLKHKSSSFALKVALNQGYQIYINDVKSDGISHTVDSLKENYNVIINHEARQVICVTKKERDYVPFYIPLPIRF